jgi:hypothetical protein
MKTNEQRTTLANLAKGAAMELFDIELEKVLENIDDINRDPKKARELDIVIKFVPTETQGIVLVKVGTKLKLSSFNEIKTHISYGRNEHTKQMEAYEIQRTQRSLWDDAAESDKVRQLRPKSNTDTASDN